MAAFHPLQTLAARLSPQEMVRIRGYSVVLSLPIILVAAGIIVSVSVQSVGGVSSLLIGGGLFLFGVVLQLLFSTSIACPRCGKSPYSIGPFSGPFAFAGKPLPDRVCSNCGLNLAEGKVS